MTFDSSRDLEEHKNVPSVQQTTKYFGSMEMQWKHLSILSCDLLLYSSDT